ncbi:MAG: hypothetical protein PHR77_03885 [Kiritimatiellae bacterium]|nr:hypothetical protein [Kiritimatiellia bacterium]
METLVIDDGTELAAKKWVVAEATATSDSKHIKTAKTALHFHINVDWKDGEKNYPIGWPRLNIRVPPDMQNWSNFDYLLFSIFVESSRTNLPATPLGFSLYLSGKKQGFNRPFTELQIGKWTDYKIPLREIVNTNACTGMQFHISESNYRDGDILDFWIDSIVLTRYLEPVITEAKLTEQTITADARFVEVEAMAFGIEKTKHAVAEFILTLNDKPVLTETLPLIQGRNIYQVPLSKMKRIPGNYNIKITHNGKTTVAGCIRMIGSPYQEDKQ